MIKIKNTDLHLVTGLMILFIICIFTNMILAANSNNPIIAVITCVSFILFAATVIIVDMKRCIVRESVIIER